MGLIISDKRLKVALHVLIWVIIFFFPQYIFKVFGFGDIRFLSHFYVNTIVYGLLFYVNYLWFVPKFYFRNKKAVYFLAAFLLILALYFVLVYINDQVLFNPEKNKLLGEVKRKMEEDRIGKRPPMEIFRILNFAFSSIMITGFALGLGFMERHRENERQRKELEKEKLHSELAFLKNQISPHFFFNTLNNIYSLTSIDTPAAQEAILKLSKLMRYLLYDSEHGETSINLEIEFMTNYIALMKLRLSPKVDLKVSFPSEFSDFSIPPLLFVPFIENAFKHGISNRETSFVDISMAIQNGEIQFSTSNSLFKSNQPSDPEHSGIGLDNVKKRLALLFPGKHQLSIMQTDNVFSIHLKIELE
ncbi:MAG TPA: histidine kinase [Prolixibacteraceae bacterium]|nr:histidine kinase [Prolixibacteraceae bacterium]HPS11836.1 histidine kinase [Prolixibacteraceae bacterium]